MSNTPLSEARVKTLRPRNSAYDLCDAKLKGFGLRVPPSGAKRFFILAQHRGERVWKIVGDMNAMSLDEARERAASLLATIRHRDEPVDRPEAPLFEAAGHVVEVRPSSSLAGAASRSSRCTSVPTDDRNRAGIRAHNDIFKPAVLRHLHAGGSSAHLYVGMASVLRPLTNA